MIRNIILRKEINSIFFKIRNKYCEISRQGFRTLFFDFLELYLCQALNCHTSPINYYQILTEQRNEFARLSPVYFSLRLLRQGKYSKNTK